MIMYTCQGSHSTRSTVSYIMLIRSSIVLEILIITSVRRYGCFFDFRATPVPRHTIHSFWAAVRAITPVRNIPRGWPKSVLLLLRHKHQRQGQNRNRVCKTGSEQSIKPRRRDNLANDSFKLQTTAFSGTSATIKVVFDICASSLHTYIYIYKYRRWTE